MKSSIRTGVGTLAQSLDTVVGTGNRATLCAACPSEFLLLLDKKR